MLYAPVAFMPTPADRKVEAGIETKEGEWRWQKGARVGHNVIIPAPHQLEPAPRLLPDENQPDIVR